MMSVLNIWKPGRKGTTLSQLTFYMDIAMMTLDHFGNITQPKTVSFDVVFVSCWHTKEFIKYLFFVRGFDPDAIVADNYLDILRVCFQFHTDLRIFAAIF